MPASAVRRRIKRLQHDLNLRVRALAEAALLITLQAAGPCMRSLHSTCRDACFEPIGPYAGAEPPEVLQPMALSMDPRP